MKSDDYGEAVFALLNKHDGMIQMLRQMTFIGALIAQRIVSSMTEHYFEAGVSPEAAAEEIIATAMQGWEKSRKAREEAESNVYRDFLESLPTEKLHRA